MKHDRLYEFEMALPSDPVRRGFYFSEDVRTLLDGPWTSPACESRVGRLEADLEAFVKGEEVTLCLEPYAAGDAFMGRLDAPSDEVWDIRARIPSPGLRLFGSFAAPDTFIAFTWAPRSKPWNGRQPFGDRYDPRWKQMKSECQQQWQKLFPRYNPIHGERVQNYVTEKVRSCSDS